MVKNDRLDEVAKQFMDEFRMGNPTGTIPGNNKFPVQIASVGHTPEAPRSLKSFRCPANQSAILVRWFPIKWGWLPTSVLNALAKLNQHFPGILLKQPTVEFPKNFLGFPVYYKRVKK